MKRLSRRGRGPSSSLGALSVCALVLLGACGPADDATPSIPEPLSSASTAQALPASPELSPPLSKDNWRQQGVVAASAGDITLVVWDEESVDGFSDVFAMRVRKSDGVLLDASPLCIACGYGVEFEPAVASNGTDFLVTWTELPATEPSPFPGLPGVRSVRVRASTGAVLSPAASHGSFFLNWTPSVASDGTNYLVTWRVPQVECVELPGQDQPYCAQFYTITGTRVSAATGAVGSEFVLSPSTLSMSWSHAVTYGGGNYLVTWTGHPRLPSANPSAYATRVRASDDTVLDTRPIASGATNSVMAAFDGSQFLVVWSTLGDEVRASRMGLDGTVLDPGGFPVGTGITPNVLFEGSDYRVVWGQGQELKGVRVSREGLVANGSQSVLGQNRSPNYARPALAALGTGRFLLGYTQLLEPQSRKTRVKLRVVEELSQGEGTACTQDAQCQSGFCVDGVCCQSACGGGAGNDCQACSVAAGGTANGTCAPVRADAVVVCRPSAVACDVAEVCDGTHFSCPADEPSASEPDLSGDKCEDSPCEVRAWVEGLAPVQVEPGLARSLVAKAEGACQSWRQGKAEATRGKLRALLNEVEAQRGKHLSESVADTLAAALGGML